MIVPLKIRERVLGAITLVRGVGSRTYDASDLSTAEDLAARAALAIENARLYREAEREIRVRKSAEEDVRLLNANLERRVEERTRALQETMSELDAFVQSVSHDLKTPIRAVLSLSQLLLEEHGGALDPSARQHLHRIAETGLRMNRLVGDLLTLSRLGKGPMTLQPVELERVVEDSLRHLAFEIEESRANVSVRAPLPLVLGQPMPLVQAVTNLVSNALKFVAAGAAPRVAIGADERAGRVRLWVEDHGIGVAAEDLPSLFKPFTRLSSDPRFAGTGLGLVIVRKAVERMGGSAGVESSAGKGSRFWIELPRA
jgi:signal transduction histidine kinase